MVAHSPPLALQPCLLGTLTFPSPDLLSSLKLMLRHRGRGMQEMLLTGYERSTFSPYPGLGRVTTYSIERDVLFARLLLGIPLRHGVWVDSCLAVLSGTAGI